MATAGVKISSLRELTTAEDADYIVINDVSASTTKKISRANFLKDITNDSGGGGTLDGLTDTSIESPASGDFLRYFPNNQTWRNVSFSPTFASIYEQPVTNNGADKARFENIWQNASTVLTVTANGSSAYRFDQYLITGTNVPTTDNPTIYVQAGTTIGFDLSYDAAGDNPFKIQTTAGVDVSDGILEVTSRNVYTDFTQDGAYGGTLYWKVPASYTGNYKYQCTTHSGMTGIIVVEAVDGGVVSDYRAKIVEGETENALSLVNQLKVYQTKYIPEMSEHEDKVFDSLIAHELQEVIPYAVIGEKNAVWDNGLPDYQKVNYQKLVPIMISAIQDLSDQVEDLKIQIEILRG